MDNKNIVRIANWYYVLSVIKLYEKVFRKDANPDWKGAERRIILFNLPSFL